MTIIDPALASQEPPEERRRPSILAAIIDKLVALCGVVPYALIALGLRFIVARVFFLSGQAKITGPVIHVPFVLSEGHFPVTLPGAITPSTFEMFARDYAALPVSPTVAAYVFSYAEFVLPLCLLLGFATRLSALALLILTVLMQLYVTPAAFWTVHVYLIAILLVLMTVGPGAISLDALIRAAYRRSE